MISIFGQPVTFFLFCYQSFDKTFLQFMFSILSAVSFFIIKIGKIFYQMISDIK